jgi:hypothetical protein
MTENIYYWTLPGRACGYLKTREISTRYWSWQCGLFRVHYSSLGPTALLLGFGLLYSFPNPIHQTWATFPSCIYSFFILFLFIFIIGFILLFIYFIIFIIYLFLFINYYIIFIYRSVFYFIYLLFIYFYLLIIYYYYFIYIYHSVPESRAGPNY